MEEEGSGEEERKGGMIEKVERKKGEEMKEVEKRMRRLELEGEKKRRKERKSNIIITGRTKKEGMEELRDEVKEIVKATGAVANVEEMRRIGSKDKEGREMV